MALRDAYRAMPEYPGFILLDADCPPAEVVARLARGSWARRQPRRPLPVLDP